MSNHESTEWTAAAAGDAHAFGRVFDLHCDRAYRHALRLTRDPHDAQDVVAAAFLELWRRRDAVRVVDGSVLPWLLVTVTNAALNQRRSLRRHRAFIARLPRDANPAPDAAEVALSDPELDVDPKLLSAIRALRPADQRLVALVALEGYDLATAATALDVSVAAARSRWQRVRSRLAESAPARRIAATAVPKTTEGARP